jgi:CRISPR-associated protein Csd1
VAEFLTDGLTALFGVDLEPEKDKDNKKRREARDANNVAKWEDFWRQIQEAFDATRHPALKAMLAFHTLTGSSPSFLRWGVRREAKADEKPAWWLTSAVGNEAKLGPDNFGFEVNGC